MLAAQMSINVGHRNPMGDLTAGISYFDRCHGIMFRQQKIERPRIAAGPCILAPRPGLEPD